MTLDDYQNAALITAVYPKIGHSVVYPALKLNGEAGEVAELVGKMFRDDGGDMSVDRRVKLAYELGDVLWYIAACAKELNYSLSEIAKMNIDKLVDRAARGVIKGSGSGR